LIDYGNLFIKKRWRYWFKQALLLRNFLI